MDSKIHMFPRQDLKGCNMAKSKHTNKQKVNRPSTRMRGVKTPGVQTGKVDVIKEKTSKQLTQGSTVPSGRYAGLPRNAGMLLDPGLHNISPWMTSSMPAYHTSYSSGQDFMTATRDIPPYFIMMNEQNGGMLYWPVTLREKYEWYRYFCYYLRQDAPAQVLMSDGVTKSISDISIGDEIITGAGTIRRVSETFQFQVEQNKSVRIKSWCLQHPTMVTHNHPLYILRKENVKQADGEHSLGEKIFNPQWVVAEDIRVGDYVLMSPYKPVKLSNLTPEQARFLGYYAAEGSIVWGYRCIGTDKDGDGNGWKWHQEKVKVPVGVCFTLHKDEKDTLGKKILSLAKSVFGIDGRIVHERGNSIEILVNGRNVGEFCNLHVGSGSEDKKLSKDLLDSTVESKKEFLLGYAEGDGHQYQDNRNKGKILIATVSENLASQVQTLAISAGIMCRIAKYNRGEDDKGWNSKSWIWHITIPSWSANDLISSSEKWVRQDTREDQRCAFFINGYAAFKIREISYSEETDTVYNIGIDAEGDEQSFVCNGIVSHNSRTDAYVGRALELMSDLPMSKISLNMPKMDDKPELREEIKRFFEDMCDKLQLFDKMQSILWEYNMIGNCLLPSSKVYTPDGEMPISEIREGDLVSTQSGEYHKVSKTMRRKVRENLVSLSIAKLPEDFVCTKEHPILVCRGKDDVFIKASEIRRGDRVALWRSAKDSDVEHIDITNEWRSGRFDWKYDSVDVSENPNSYNVMASYTTRQGNTQGVLELRNILLSWLGSLKEPVCLTCEELSEKLGIDDFVRLRTIAYYLRSKGIIKTERTSKGRMGGSSIRWFPVDSNMPLTEHVDERKWEKVFSSSIKSVDINNDFMYLLGFWLGDGWLWKYDHNAKSYRAFDIVMCKKSPIRERVISAAESVFGTDNVEITTGSLAGDDGNLHIVVNDSLFCEWWGTEFGDCCENKKIPEWVVLLPSEKLKMLLAGLVDSDGSVCETPNKGHTLAICTTNRKLANSIFRIGLKSGIPFSFRSNIPNFKIDGSPAKMVNILGISCDDKIALLSGSEKVRGSDLQPEESRSPNTPWTEAGGVFYAKVVDVSETFYSGYVYNIEVENEHTYCADNVQTHNCFAFMEWDEKEKKWTRICMLPPEEVHVFSYPFTDYSRIEYRPQFLVRMISAYKENGTAANDEQRTMMENIPQDVIDSISERGFLVMDSDPMIGGKPGSFVHHFARRRSPYMDLGASVLERVLVPLLIKEHYKYVQLGVSSRNMTPKNIIWSPNLSPASTDDLRTQVDLSYLDPEYSIVTNYEVHWDQIGAESRLIDLTSEYEWIENQIFAGLGVTRELLTGEGTYTGNRVTIEILNTIFLLVRNMLQNFVENRVFLPVAEAKGWFETDKNGIKKYWYPKLGFNRLTIRDNQEVFESLFQLYQKGSLPVDIIYELFNLNTEDIHTKIHGELFTVKDPNFNRVTEAISADVGRSIAEETDIVARVAKYLNLEMKPEPEPEPEQQSQEDSFGEPLGDEMGSSEYSTTEQPEPTSESEEIIPEDNPSVDDLVIEESNP